MEHIRIAVETCARRLTAAGLLGVATIVALLGSDSRLAVDATALLLSLEAALLWQLGRAVHVLPLDRAPAWLVVPGSERRGRKVLDALMAEALQSCARLMMVPVALAWGAALAVRL